MELPLPLHLLLHFSLAILIGYLLGRHFKKVGLGVLFGFLGGFLIDLDHVLEYFFVYGPHFNLIYFFEGRQFLASGKIRVIFHAWEYLPLLLLLALIFKKHQAVRAAIITLALAASVHLLTDSFLNKYPIQYYALSYRYENSFEAKNLLNPAQYGEMTRMRDELGL
ncbi:MAG: hypothetical protein WC905_02435 [Patescibacteria group bacterium]|jgi:hypothetical protein